MMERFSKIVESLMLTGQRQFIMIVLMRKGLSFTCLLLAIFFVSSCTDSESVIGTEKNRYRIITYEDVRPIFRENCAVVGCHIGEWAPHGLRLDSYEHILKGSAHDVIVVAGIPKEGALMYRLTGVIPPSMPLGKQLDPAQIELIRLWILDGLRRD
jgi:hypothetical protein